MNGVPETSSRRAKATPARAVHEKPVSRSPAVVPDGCLPAPEPERTGTAGSAAGSRTASGSSEGHGERYTYLGFPHSVRALAFEQCRDNAGGSAAQCVCVVPCIPTDMARQRSAATRCSSALRLGPR